jgi:hypothetical protein
MCVQASRMSYADSNFLIYVSWDKCEAGKSTISGSLLLDSALTIEEAQEKVAMYKERAETFRKETWDDPNVTRRYTYIDNRREWWPAAAAPPAKLTADLPVE